MEGSPRSKRRKEHPQGGTKTSLSHAHSTSIRQLQRQPSLVYLFKQLRREDREALTKEDMRQVLGGSVDSAELDAAFEKLDTDKDGEISFDEFIAGFAQYLSPQAPAVVEQGKIFDFSPAPARSGPSEAFKSSLRTLSMHGRQQSIQRLWGCLAATDHKLLEDFEEFVAQLASEVECAQTAKNKQRSVSEQEALQLDEELESRLSDARSKLEIENVRKREQARVKMEQRLMDKEAELTEVKHKLEEVQTQAQARLVDKERELTEARHKLGEEKQELQFRLEVTEDQLEQMQSTLHQQKMAEHRSWKDGGVVGEGMRGGEGGREELEPELREELESFHQQNLSDSDDELLSVSEAIPPDLWTPLTNRLVFHSGTLLDEIMEREGVASPMLRGEPFMHFTIPGLSKRTFRSLPDLTQISCPDVAMTHTPVGLAHSLPTIQIADIEVADQVAAIGGRTPPLGEGPIEVPKGWMMPPSDGHVTPPLEDEPRAPPKQPVTITVVPALEDESGGPREGGDVDLKETDVGDRGDESPATGVEEQGDEAGERVPPDGRVTPPPEVRVTTPLEEDDDNTYEIVEAPEEEPLEFIDNLATQPDYVFKILVVGNSYVGKSAFLMRLCTNAFATQYAATIGVDYFSRTLRAGDKTLSLQLWDTAGQERFQSVTNAYYRGAQGVILMYDVSREESFLAVRPWIKTIQENTDDMPVGMLLVGNKADLGELGKREVSTKIGKTFSEIYGADFIETSAKTGYNVGSALTMLVRSIRKQYELGYTGSQHEQSIQVSKATTSKNKCCRCPR